MDDCAALAEILEMGERVLADLERKAAGHTSLTIPSTLSIELNDKRQEVENLKAKLIRTVIERKGILGNDRSHQLSDKNKNYIFNSSKIYKPTEKNSLSQEEVMQGLEVLIEDARHFQPMYILGINRGGAIVGGCIAKRLNIPYIYLLIVNCDLPDGERVIENRIPMDKLEGRILLVDDAKRKGEHMREATQYLQQKYPQIILRRQVLLEMQIKHAGPEKVSFLAPPVERAAFFTGDGSVILPWDS